MAPAPDTSKILQALADMAKTNTAAGMPPQASSSNVSNLQSAFTQHMPSSVNPASSVPPASQSVSGVPGAANGANPFGGLSSAPNFAQGMPNGQMGMQANAMPQGTSPEALQQQVQLLQMLQAQNVPQEQWATLLSVLMSAGAVGGGASNAAAQPWQAQNQGYAGRDDPSRDRNGYNDQYNIRSPSGRYRSHRSRSRSPTGWDRRREPSPPRRRDSPVYGDYGRDGGRGGRGVRGRGNDYRQRSPDRNRRSASPSRQGQDQSLPPPGPKNLQYDQSLPPNHIKGKPPRIRRYRINTHYSHSSQPNTICWWCHVSQGPCEPV